MRKIHYIKNKVANYWLWLLTLAFVANTSCSNDIEDNLRNYPTASQAGAVYYVDSENGDDNFSGLSAEKAWKSLTKAQNVVLQGGNKVLLKKGSSWKGSLSLKGSGTASNPITLGSYGEGNRPIIDGEGKVKAVVYLSNQSNWVIQDLELKNYNADRGDIYRCGILVENDNGSTVSNIQILNNYVHDVSGSFRYQGESHPHQYGGIAVNVIGKTSTDKFDNVLIEGNVVEKAGRTGIVVWDNLFASDADASTNVVIRNNKVKDIDSDGILTFGCNGSLLEYNVADACGSYREDDQFNGSAAIWVTRGKNCIVQHNEAMNTKALEGNADGTGFDIDMDAIDCIVQYNYSHDNEGGFMLFVDASNSSGSIVRYNISQNDKTRIFMIAGGVTPKTQIYNNTIYVGSGLNTNIIEHTWDDGGDINASWTFKNNIVYNLGSGIYQIPGTGGTFEGNLYYGNHPAGEPQEADKLTSDPLFENVGSGGIGLASIGGYKLKNNSPAKSSGVLISRNGGQDFWGTIVSSRNNPTRGAHELVEGDAHEIAIIDNFDNWDYVNFYSSNWNLDNSNPQFFHGDGSRAVRTSFDDGIIVYNYPNIKDVMLDFHLCIWYPTITPDIIEIWISEVGGDFSNFQKVATIDDTDPTVTDGWQKTTKSNAVTFPDGTNYVGIRVTDSTGEAWATQVGKITIIHEETE